MTKEELKAMLPVAWFENPNDLIMDSFEEFYTDVTQKGVEPTDEYFAMLVNANVAEYYTCSAQNSHWY